MVASPAVPGLFLCFAATVLLIFVCVSAPTWDKISFLNVGAGVGNQIRYGVFGFTGSKVGIGYDFQSTGLGQSNLNTTVVHNLTKTLILHPIAAGLAGLAFLFGLCGASYHRIGTILMTLLSGLAMIVTLVAFVIDMVLFGIVRNRLRNADIPAQYGNANWLTLGALIALLLGFCASACGVFGRYRRRKEATY
ncbi:actin cortical patch SUR7/pH-response regulator pali [Lyophyllum atratum]|nr:actin cortical patch SUR7/pH-response regulator pali [Lyophyllum atratum]